MSPDHVARKDWLTDKQTDHHISQVAIRSWTCLRNWNWHWKMDSHYVYMETISEEKNGHGLELTSSLFPPNPRNCLLSSITMNNRKHPNQGFEQSWPTNRKACDDEDKDEMVVLVAVVDSSSTTIKKFARSGWIFQVWFLFSSPHRSCKGLRWGWLGWGWGSGRILDMHSRSQMSLFVSDIDITSICVNFHLVLWTCSLLLAAVFRLSEETPSGH